MLKHISVEIITHPLDVWINKTRDERGFGGKSLILERIPTQNEILPLLYLFVVCCLLIASIHGVFFKPQKSRNTPKTRVLKYGGEVEHKRGEGETVRLMATEERVIHFQTCCILVQKKKRPLANMPRVYTHLDHRRYRAGTRWVGTK